MQARYYDPVIGRFYGNDPIGFRDVHSFNRFAYANNNPYKYVDPDGMSSKKKGGGGSFPAGDPRNLDNPAGLALMETILDIINNPDDWTPKRIEGDTTLQNNKKVGKDFENHVKEKIDKGTPANVTVSEQVTLKPAEGRNTVMDLVVSDGNNSVCVECKASDKAPFTPNQKAEHPQIQTTGATVQGAGKPAVPEGTVIKPSPVIVVRPKRKRQYLCR